MCNIDKMVLISIFLLFKCLNSMISLFITIVAYMSKKQGV